MKLSQIHSNGLRKINTGGKRDKGVEALLGQTDPRRDWVNGRHLPNIKILRYASQLTKRWPEFERDELPRILAWINKYTGSRYEKVSDPARMHIKEYCKNTGYKLPPESKWVLGDINEAYNEAITTIVNAFSVLGHPEIVRLFVELYEVTSKSTDDGLTYNDDINYTSRNHVKKVMLIISRCKSASRKKDGSLKPALDALFSQIVDMTNRYCVSGHSKALKIIGIIKEKLSLLGPSYRLDLPTIPNNNKRALTKHRPNKWVSRSS